jgi:hypothetical protein
MGFAKKEVVAIKAPNIQIARITVIGDAPLVHNRFPEEAKNMMMAKQAAGSTAKKGNRAPKDFDASCLSMLHQSKDKTWCGLPASAFRCGLISACRLVGFPMTKAKLSIFVIADGYEEDGTPLVKLTKGNWHRFDTYTKNADDSCDIRSRPMFDPGWEAVVTIKFDADQFSLSDVTNLLARMGAQVGICAGRPDSSNSTGCGWGTFMLGEAAPTDGKAAA